MNLSNDNLISGEISRKNCLFASHNHSSQDPKYSYLFSVEMVNELVNQGMPFRDAYKEVGNQIEKGTFSFDISKGLNHTHEGSIGNLCNKEIEMEMKKSIEKFN